LYMGTIVFIFSLLITSAITWVPGQGRLPFLIAGVAVQAIFLIPTMLTRAHSRRRLGAKVSCYLIPNGIAVALFGILTGTSICLVVG
jgi:hypothetical protein